MVKTLCLGRGIIIRTNCFSTYATQTTEYIRIVINGTRQICAWRLWLESEILILNTVTTSTELYCIIQIDY